MSVFAYTALSKDGRRTSGTLTADTRAGAIAQMSRQGLSPVKIDETKEAAAKKAAHDKASGGGMGTATVPGARVARVPQKSVESFTRELANLLAGGVPLSRALSLLRRESSNPNA